MFSEQSVQKAETGWKKVCCLRACDHLESPLIYMIMLTRAYHDRLCKSLSHFLCSSFSQFEAKVGTENVRECLWAFFKSKRSSVIAKLGTLNAVSLRNIYILGTAALTMRRNNLKISDDLTAVSWQLID